MTDTSISLVSQRPRSMPPGALALAILLHAAALAAIWWFAPQRPQESQDEPIMVMFDSSPSNVGLQAPEKPGPPAESEAASPSPSNEPPAKEAEPQQALAPAPTPAPAPEPPQPEPPSVTPPQPEEVASLPRFEFSIPPTPSPPPAPSAQEFTRPPTPRPPATAVPRTTPAPPRPAPPAPYRPPAQAPATMPSPVPGPEPGDVLMGQGRQRNDYLSRVARQIAQHRVYPAVAASNRQEGRVVMRVTVARTGHVLEVRVGTSSGWPAIDAAEAESIRKAAPFPPVPGDMPGDPIILVLPMTYNLSRR